MYLIILRSDCKSSLIIPLLPITISLVLLFEWINLLSAKFFNYKKITFFVKWIFHSTDFLSSSINQIWSNLGYFLIDVFSKKSTKVFGTNPYIFFYKLVFVSTRSTIKLWQFYRDCYFTIIIMMHCHGITKITVTVIKVTIL